MSEEITRTVVEEGALKEDPFAVCKGYLEKHGQTLRVYDNDRFKHNESKLMREPKYVASAAGFLRDGYGDTPEEAIQDFNESLLTYIETHLSHCEKCKQETGSPQ